MKIKNIVLENWRGFEGKEVINFSTDENKKINLIIAENGTGKSNIIEGIHWCLYDSMPDGADKPDEKITGSAAIRSQKAKVTIKIEDDKNDKSYQLSRLLKTNIAESEPEAIEQPKTRNDQPRRLENYNILVEKLLPAALKDFFLFSGEGVKRYFSGGENTLKSAILNVQGSKWADETLKELKDEIEKRSLELQKSEANQGEVEAAKNNIKANTEERALLKKDLEKKKEEYKKNNLRLKEIEALLRESGVEEVGKLEQQISVQKEIIRGQDEIIRLNKAKKRELLNDKSFSVLAFIMKDSMTNLFQELEAEELIPGEISKPYTNKIIERGVCICGRKFEKDSREYKSILKIQEGAETKEMEEYRTKTQVMIENFDRENEEFQTAYSECVTNNNSAHNKIAAANEEIKKLDDKIKDIGDKDVTKLKQEQKKLEEKNFNIYSIEITNINSKIETKNHEIKENQDKVKRLATIDRSDPKYKKLSFLKKSSEILHEQIEVLKKEGREKMGNHLNELCKKYSRKGHRFKYKDENSYYPLMLDKKSARENPANTGDKVLKAIFYTASIISFCRERYQDKDTLIQPGTIAPMICDAIFSDLDKTNSKSASKVLIDTPEQLIIFLNCESFEKGFENALDKKLLGKLYYLQRSVRGQGLDEEISIYGKKYSPWVYNQEVERTKVVEIKT